MNPKTVVILILLLVLSGAAFMLTRPGTEVPTDENHPLSADVQLIPAVVLGSTLDTIDLGPYGFDHEASTQLNLSLIRGQWDVIYPHVFPADTRTIDELLNHIATVTGQATQEHYHKVPPIKPEDLIGVEGVIPADPPAIVLHNDSNQAWVITLGARLGAGRAVLFIQTPDKTETAYHATDTLHDYFENFDPDAYYANAFDPPLMPEVGRIEITTPEGESVLVQADGQWWIETDRGKERALETSLPDHPGIKNYFDLFNTAELIEKQTNYPTNGMAAFGLKKPLISVRLVPVGEDHNEQANGYEVHIGTPADPLDQTRYISNGYAGQATHPVFTIDSKTALAFAQDATLFRDPRMIATPSTLIQSIGLKFAGGVFQMIELKVDGPPVLRLAEDDARALSTERLAAAIKQLADARAMDYVPTQLAQWKAMVSVLITPRLAGEPEPFTVYVDPQTNPDEPTILIHRGVEPVALRVPRRVIAGLLDPMILVPDDDE